MRSRSGTRTTRPSESRTSSSRTLSSLLDEAVGEPAAIGDQRLAGYEGSLVRDQEKAGVRDVLGAAKPALRRSRFERTQVHLSFSGKSHHEAGLDETGRNSVDTHR